MTKIFLFVQLKIVKSAVGVYDEAPEPEIIEVPASSSSYLFKNLFGSTSYSLTVFARNDAGRGMQHIDPFTKKTEPGKCEEYGRAKCQLGRFCPEPFNWWGIFKPITKHCRVVKF